ncbi:MAG: ChbG/HpnK family deacetylase, partial [Bacteroidales bacterium]|nr:ChbG/HpnK family deacetylase [Bacteroidales bacterium]
EDGFFFGYPEELRANNPKPEEMEAEARAQIELALKNGINVQYIDIHYGSVDGEIVEKLGREYNIPVSGRMGEKHFQGVYLTPEKEKKESAVKMLDELEEPGVYLWVCHIGIDSPEQDALIHTKPESIFPGGGVGKHRAAELDVLTSFEVKSIILRKDIKLTNYKELWEEQKKKE